jgi:hypothetical protein
VGVVGVTACGALDLPPPQDFPLVSRFWDRDCGVRPPILVSLLGAAISCLVNLPLLLSARFSHNEINAVKLFQHPERKTRSHG